MADNNVAQIGENSKEQIAFKLLEVIMKAEKKVLHSNLGMGETRPDRKYILDTYAEALLTVRSPQGREE